MYEIVFDTEYFFCNVVRLQKICLYFKIITNNEYF